MNQDQQPRPWWRDNRLAWILAALALTGLVIITILGYSQRWSWTELLWRWLELLIIPLVLALGAFWFNNQTRKSERELSQAQVQEEALQRYLDRMQELILDKGLRRSEKGTEIREVARARTLTVLRSLDGNRKGQVVRFLYEADLIGNVEEESVERRAEAIIDLRTADLSGAILSELFLSDYYIGHAGLSEHFLYFVMPASLSGAILSGANLWYAKLGGANLSHANLNLAILRGADLSGADLNFAILTSAYLSGADLSRAKLGDAHLDHAYLSGANLRNANLSNADLSLAILTDANLSGANLSGANLSGANLNAAYGWTNEQLAQAESLVGATLPNGTKITEEDWEEFKKKGYW